MGKYIHISESVVYRDVYKQMWLGPVRAPVVATEFKNWKINCTTLKQGRSEQMYFVMCMSVCNDPRSCICTDFIVYTLYFHTQALKFHLLFLNIE